jgi:hypothetical protein
LWSSSFVLLCSFLPFFFCFAPSTEKADIINVDIKHPECNREVIVVPFTDKEMDGILHDGFVFMVEGVDVRDFISKKFKARLVSSNEILVAMPAVSHYWLHDSSAFNACLTRCGLYCQRADEAQAVARNNMLLQNRDRQTKYLLLRFPDNLKLSNLHFSPNSTDGNIEIDVVPLKNTVDIPGNEMQAAFATVVWKVTVLEDEQRVVRLAANAAQTNGAAQACTTLIKCEHLNTS